jgi:hypothetical protein
MPRTRVTRFVVSGAKRHQGIGAAAAVLLAALIIGGCASHQKQPAAAPSPSSPPADSAPPPGAEAKINISYSHPGDYLSSLVVTKYSLATNLLTTPGGKQGSESIVRFSGDVRVWQIDVDKGLLSDVPIIGKDQPYAPSEVKYGLMPNGFVQTAPNSGPPEPLEPSNYYVFSVTRASGSTSFEAVKVDSDGSLEAYAAEPRAGTSFSLCCNLSADFTSSVGTSQGP